MFKGFAKYSLLSVAVVLMTACGKIEAPNVEEGTTQSETNTTQSENNTTQNETNTTQSENNTTTDTAAPVFTSSNTVTVAENQTSALTLIATDANDIIYSLSGGESSRFDVNASTGVVAFKVAPNFETLATYTFTATATDALGNASTQEETITSSDVAEEQAPKKTGQTKSYDASGTEVTDGSNKDDGFYQKGTTPSYTRDDTTNIVNDHVTGLQWQDNAEAKTITKNWADAKTYCNSLSLDGGGWRLPTIQELRGLSDYGRTNPAINPVFVNSASNNYWSFTTYAGSSDSAWHIYLGYGDQSNNKTSSDYVRCVRVGGHK